MHILICYPQIPFVSGGTETLVTGLRQALRGRGHEAEIASVPFRWNPGGEIVRNCMAWRLLDLASFEGRKIDLVICTKFPSYLVRHPRKVTYLVHQFRQAYDLHGTEYGAFADTPEDNRVREMVVEMDNRFLRESRRIFAISKNVAGRLRRFNNLDSEVLYPPPPGLERLRGGRYGDYVLSVGRLNRSKRVDLLIRALASADAEVRCEIVGEGEEREALETLAARSGVAHRVRFRGRIGDDDLVGLYANCFAVFHAPYDEDYGFATLEAFASGKPVVTTADAGGVLEFVEDGRTGCVAAPNPGAVAGRIDDLFFNREFCGRLGQAGQERIGGISWDRVIDGLLSSC